MADITERLRVVICLYQWNKFLNEFEKERDSGGVICLSQKLLYCSSFFSDNDNKNQPKENFV